MTCLQTPLVQRVFALAGLAAMAAGAASCSAAQAGDVPNVDVSQQALDFGPLQPLAEACGLGCPGDKDDKGVTIQGIAQGNAAISGVASVDGFFAAVLRFQSASESVAKGIDAELGRIRADFGIDAKADIGVELNTKFAANLEGSVEFKAEPAKCEADIKASLKAKARCEGELNPPMVKVECKGGCEVDASVEAKCDASADLECTIVPPNFMCEGSCQGSCTAMLTAKAACSGTCRGSCDGTCSAYVKNTMGQAECAGQCSGMCMGSCEAELAAGAKCEGQCKGECTVTNPMAGCKGAIRAECKGKANASIMCDGKCDGDITPPSGKVECQASAKAEAKINVQCTPPRVTLAYKLKATGSAQADIIARAKFEAALKLLVSTRLPALKAQLARGNSVAGATTDLAAAARTGIKGALEASAKANLRTKVGLLCAGDQLGDAASIVESAGGELKTKVDDATKVLATIKAG